MYVKNPQKRGETTMEQGLKILTLEKISLMNTMKNTRYYFSIQNPTTILSQPYSPFFLVYLVWSASLSFIVQEIQLDYMNVASSHWSPNMRRLVQPCIRTAAAAEREREKDSVGQGRALSHSAPMRGLQGCTDLTLQAADQQECRVCVLLFARLALPMVVLGEFIGQQPRARSPSLVLATTPKRPRL